MVIQVRAELTPVGGVGRDVGVLTCAFHARLFCPPNEGGVLDLRHIVD